MHVILRLINLASVFVGLGEGVCISVSILSSMSCDTMRWCFLSQGYQHRASLSKGRGKTVKHTDGLEVFDGHKLFLNKKLVGVGFEMGRRVGVSSGRSFDKWSGFLLLEMM